MFLFWGIVLSISNAILGNRSNLINNQFSGKGSTPPLFVILKKARAFLYIFKSLRFSLHFQKLALSKKSSGFSLHFQKARTFERF